ncbi:MAG: hypothetical protein J7K53_09100 [Bacteroidales bacterium]|nr:hypothetical protein [Bacteroidales bacterium]
MAKSKKIEIGTKVQSKKDPLIKGVVKAIRKDEETGDKLFVLTNNLRFASEELEII